MTTTRSLVRRSATILCGAVLTSLFVTAPPAGAAEILSCLSRPTRDLNGDGYPDAVVGDPGATVNGQAEAGTVTILFGDDDGRIGEGTTRRVLTQTDFGETPEAGDHFGWAVTVGATDELCPGIYIGAPGEDAGGAANAGIAHIITMNVATAGSPPRDVTRTLDQGDMAGTVEAGDEFGSSVLSSEANDYFENPIKYAIGAPGENNDSGVVNRTVQSGPGYVQVRQGIDGVPGTAQTGDRFGETLVRTRISTEPRRDDEYFDFVVGAPGETVNGHRGAGSVTDISSSGNSERVFTQDSSGVPGQAETGDRFGASLAANRNLDSRADPFMVAVGAPGEDIGSAKDAGSVTVFKKANTGNPDQLVRLPTLSLTQATAGVAGTAEAGDQFGAAVAYRDGRTLAIGIPGEDLGTVKDAGSVQIVRVGKSNLGFPSPSITEDSPGTPGVVQANSRFGQTIVALLHAVFPPPLGESVFAVASPNQDGGSVYVLSSDPDIAPRFWKPGVDGIPGTGVHFGFAVG